MIAELTLYDVLGVDRRASPAEIRQAYHGLARALHPDRLEGAGGDMVGAERRMQEINEAWRILRDPPTRAAYDASLGMKPARPARTPPSSSSSPGPSFGAPSLDDDDDLDTPFLGRPAEPGDLTVSVARALPWLVVAIVLGAIFVFTAFARKDDSASPSPSALVGHCVSSGGGAMMSVPCAGPNEGKVVAVESSASDCPSGSSARAMSKQWLCLEPVTGGQTGTTSAPPPSTSPSLPSASLSP